MRGRGKRVRGRRVNHSAVSPPRSRNSSSSSSERDRHAAPHLEPAGSSIFAYACKLAPIAPIVSFIALALNRRLGTARRCGRSQMSCIAAAARSIHVKMACRDGERRLRLMQEPGGGHNWAGVQALCLADGVTLPPGSDCCERSPPIAAVSGENRLTALSIAAQQDAGRGGYRH